MRIRRYKSAHKSHYYYHNIFTNKRDYVEILILSEIPWCGVWTNPFKRTMIEYDGDEGCLTFYKAKHDEEYRRLIDERNSKQKRDVPIQLYTAWNKELAMKVRKMGLAQYLFPHNG